MMHVLLLVCKILDLLVSKNKHINTQDDDKELDDAQEAPQYLAVGVFFPLDFSPAKHFAKSTNAAIPVGTRAQPTALAKTSRACKPD